MEKPTHLTEEDLKSLQDFHQKSEQLTVYLGQLQFRKHKLKKDEDFLNKQIDLLEETEVELNKKLKDTYGNVNVDIKTGELTYSQE